MKTITGRNVRNAVRLALENQSLILDGTECACDVVPS
jgi:hypothetical protein